MSNEIDLKKEELKNEIDELKHEFKIELPKRIAEARAHGDLKENAEYHAARERQGFVRAKLAQLTEQLARISNIDMNDVPEDKVGFGSKVVIEDSDSGFTMEFKFVTDAETNPSEGKISLSTPYGKALAGKGVGEMVEVTTPVGVKKFMLKNLVTIQGNEYTV